MPTRKFSGSGQVSVFNRASGLYIPRIPLLMSAGKMMENENSESLRTVSISVLLRRQYISRRCPTHDVSCLMYMRSDAGKQVNSCCDSRMEERRLCNINVSGRQHWMSLRRVVADCMQYNIKIRDISTKYCADSKKALYLKEVVSGYSCRTEVSSSTQK